jgi:RecG-like helicase
MLIKCDFIQHMSNQPTEIEREVRADHQFYWMARLLTSEEDDPLEAAEALVPDLKKWAREGGLSVAGLWVQLREEVREFLEKRGEDLPKDWWRPQ